MITKERLKQLIEQKAKIYAITEYAKEPIMINLGFFTTINGYSVYYEFKDLFETKEEAQWELNFGNIKRTETLRLPSWEEFCKTNELDIYFRTPNQDMINFWIYDTIEIENTITDCSYIENYKQKRLTKENYINACNIAKKLFLGE